MIISYPISSNLTTKCCFSLLLKTTFRSSRLQMFFKIDVLKNFTIFTGKHLCWNKFIKKRLQLTFFSYEYCKIFKNRCFYRTPPVVVSGHLYHFLIFLWLLCSLTMLSFCIDLFRSKIFKKKKVTPIKRARGSS